MFRSDRGNSCPSVHSAPIYNAVTYMAEVEMSEIQGVIQGTVVADDDPTTKAHVYGPADDNELQGQDRSSDPDMHAGHDSGLASRVLRVVFGDRARRE